MLIGKKVVSKGWCKESRKLIVRISLHADNIEYVFNERSVIFNGSKERCS